MEQIYIWARELCLQDGQPSQLFPILQGLFMYYFTQAQLQAACEVGTQALHLARQQREIAPHLIAHRMLGCTSFLRGEFTLARSHFEEVLTLYNPQQHHVLAYLYGSDPRVGSLLFLTRTLVVCGHPDDAVRRIHDALPLAHTQAHPHSVAHVLHAAVMIHHFRRERQAVQAQTAVLTALCEEQGFALLLAGGKFWQGWVLAAQGRGQEGITQMRQSFATIQALGSEMWTAYWLSLLAEVYRDVGQIADGLALLGQALVHIDRFGKRWWEAEIHRFRGGLLLAQSSDDPSEAVICFQKALEVARSQQAKSLELCAATSLARLWQGQEKRDEARELLASIYDWFTEGFDTADLRDAKILLDELA